MKLIITTLLLMAGSVGYSAENKEPIDWSVWSKMVVLDGGRVKPFDTFAWESIYAIAGKSKFEPKAFALVSLSDVEDWSKLAKAVSESPTLSSTLPADIKAELTKVHFDTAEKERQFFSLDRQIEDRILEASKEQGVPLTRRQFRANPGKANRELLDKYDTLLAEIDKIGRVKEYLLKSINEHISNASSGGKEESVIASAETRRREIEKELGDAIKPLPTDLLPTDSPIFEARKYDPVALAITLALSWRGWDNVGEWKSSRLEMGEPIKMYLAAQALDTWDATPMIDARYEDLGPRLLPETAALVSPRTVRDNPWFFSLAVRSHQIKGDKTRKSDLTTADQKAVAVLDAYQAYTSLRTGVKIAFIPDQNVKSRVDAISKGVGDLTKRLEGKSHADAGPILNEWRQSIDQENLAAKDLDSIADRLAKELPVQASSKTPIPVSALVEQQARLRIEEAGNEVDWIRLSDLLAGTIDAQKAGYDPAKLDELKSLVLDARKALLAGQTGEFNQASTKLANALSDLGKNSHVYPSAQAIQTELDYNRFQPFLWTAVISGIALLILTLTFGLKTNVPYYVGFATLVSAVCLMVYGMYMRIAISGRPPVTNLYETIIWASFVMTSLGITLGAIYGHRIIVLGAALALTPATLLAYVMPPELGASIDPLVPVLRDNFWLVIHVLTIVASYGAFMLAWMLGNVGLGYYLVGADKSPSVKPIALYIYRCIQVGVILLAAGTILGGWWAAYSWGRFWGWDPKEVWALIALIGYLAVLHARFAGLVKIFGLIAWSVVAFAGVIMSWYGVNFLLGEGLHAYAFGSGGEPIVLSIVAANLGYVALVAALRKARTMKKKFPPDNDDSDDASDPTSGQSTDIAERELANKE